MLKEATFWLLLLSLLRCTLVAGEKSLETRDLSVSDDDNNKKLAAIQNEVDSLRSLYIQQQRQLEDLKSDYLALLQRFDKCSCSDDGGNNSFQDDGNGVINQNTQEDTMVDNSGFDSSSVVNIDIKDEDWVKEVFFGGTPWVLHCTDPRSTVKQEVPEVIADAAVELKTLAMFGALNCWERLPSSGKTLAQRFGFPKPPVTVAVANGDPPILLNLQDVRRPSQLKSKIDLYLNVQVTEIDGLPRFKALCSRRRACLVVGFQSMAKRVAAVEALVPALKDHRGIRAVALDTTVWQWRIETRLAGTKPVVGLRGADLLCLWRDGSQRAGSFFRLGGEVEDIALPKFLRNCEAGKHLIGISEIPWISHRGRSRQRPSARPSPRSRSRPRSNPSSGRRSKHTSSEGLDTEEL